MNEQEICRLYTEERLTLRDIASRYNTDHHTIHRVLDRNGIKIDRANRIKKPFSIEHRRKIGERSKGRTGWNKGLKMDEEARRKNMKSRSGSRIDFNQYPDYDRLLFLNKMVSKRRGDMGTSDEVHKAFLDKFYYDPQFNLIYDLWIESGKNKWYRPTLDHKRSLFNGGNWELDNLQFLTWFENRAKAEMNEEDWLIFCQETNTTSDLFVRVSNG